MTNTRGHLIKHARATRLRATLFALILAAFFSSPVFAQCVERRIDGWRPLHYDVSLVFNRDLSELTRAETKIDARVLKDSLAVVDLDFAEMPVDSVRVNNEPAHYERTPGRLDVSLARPVHAGDQLLVAVAYHGRPADGLILTKDKDGNPSATGDNWPQRVHYWIPSLDHPSAKATVSFNVTFPIGFTAVANGTTIRQEWHSDSTISGSWTQGTPIPPYCMIIAVGKFAVREPSPPAYGSPFRVPISYYVPPSNEAFALQGFGAAPFALGYFDQLVSPFPYEKLAHIVGATRYGGMENASAIVYPSTLFDPRSAEPLSQRFGIRRGLVEVVAHETAHQWFGDAVTPATWSDLWLSEGFATYFAGLFIERYEGEAAFRDYMNRAQDAYLRYEKIRRAPIYDTETSDLNKLLNANNYQKAAWVLHALRAQLGEAIFFRGIRLYYDAHKDGNATTEDLRAALERASGRDLRQFFARWIYASGHPVYRASLKWRASRAGGIAVFTLAQEQETEPFLTPVPVEFITTSGHARRLIVRPTGRETTVIVPLASRPVNVLVDPAGTILKEVHTDLARKAASSM